MFLPPPASPLFPYTTLFRSKGNTFATTAFLSYGLFWLSLVTLIIVAKLGWATIISVTSESQNRSEEHTSELQSRRDLVCRLLLAKKQVQFACSDRTVLH